LARPMNCVQGRQLVSTSGSRRRLYYRPSDHEYHSGEIPDRVGPKFPIQSRNKRTAHRARRCQSSSGRIPPTSQANTSFSDARRSMMEKIISTSFRARREWNATTRPVIRTCRTSRSCIRHQHLAQCTGSCIRSASVSEQSGFQPPAARDACARSPGQPPAAEIPAGREMEEGDNDLAGIFRRDRTVHVP